MKAIFLAIGLLCISTSVQAQTRSFTVTARYPADTLPAPLYLRGDGCGLNWDQGIRMQEVSHTDWAVTLQCQSSETLVEMKALIGDQTWMRGGN